MVFKYYPGIAAKIYVFLRSVILLSEEIEKHVPRQGLVYDAGCGYGLIAQYLALSGPQRKVVGIDVDQRRIEAARKAITLANLSFEVKDLSRGADIPPCDCILMYDLLHHLPYEAQEKLVLAARKKLNPGGVLLIKEIDLKPEWKLLFTYVLDKIVTRGARMYYSPAQERISFLKEAGFRVEYKRLRSFWPYPHYLLVCSV